MPTFLTTSRLAAIHQAELRAAAGRDRLRRAAGAGRARQPVLMRSLRAAFLRHPSSPQPAPRRATVQRPPGLMALVAGPRAEPATTAPKFQGISPSPRGRPQRADSRTAAKPSGLPPADENWPYRY
jgi:hypothetical protein